MHKNIVYEKGIRLFKEGKVKLEFVGRNIHFRVRGDRGEYNVIFWGRGNITCTCPYCTYYPDKLCSHKIACMLLLNELKIRQYGKEM